MCSGHYSSWQSAWVLQLKAPAGAYVLATDIDDKALQEAKNGVYESRSMISTPKAYVDRYFEIVDGMYKVKDVVIFLSTAMKGLINSIFPQDSLLAPYSDPPEVQKQLQSQVIHTFEVREVYLIEL